MNISKKSGSVALALTLALGLTSAVLADGEGPEVEAP